MPASPPLPAFGEPPASVATCEAISGQHGTDSTLERVHHSQEKVSELQNIDEEGARVSDIHDCKVCDVIKDSLDDDDQSSSSSAPLFASPPMKHKRNKQAPTVEDSEPLIEPNDSLQYTADQRIENIIPTQEQPPTMTNSLAPVDHSQVLFPSFRPPPAIVTRAQAMSQVDDSTFDDSEAFTAPKMTAIALSAQVLPLSLSMGGTPRKSTQYSQNFSRHSEPPISGCTQPTMPVTQPTQLVDSPIQRPLMRRMRKDPPSLPPAQGPAPFLTRSGHLQHDFEVELVCTLLCPLHQTSFTI